MTWWNAGYPDQDTLRRYAAEDPHAPVYLGCQAPDPDAIRYRIVQARAWRTNHPGPLGQVMGRDWLLSAAGARRMYMAAAGDRARRAEREAAAEAAWKAANPDLDVPF